MKNDFEIRGDVTVIFLKRRDGSRLETIIDTADLEMAKEFPSAWCAESREDMQTFYVIGVHKGKSYRLHRWITNAPKGMEVDHLNHDGLDNRRSANLKVVTPSENQQNRKKFGGVSKCSKTGRWTAQLNVNKKHYWLGNYDTYKEAMIVVKNARAVLAKNSKEARNKDFQLINLEILLKGLKASANNKTSIVKGVYLDKRYGTWYAQIQVNHKRINLGTFATYEEALEARLQAESNKSLLLEA